MTQRPILPFMDLCMSSYINQVIRGFRLTTNYTIILFRISSHDNCATFPWVIESGIFVEDAAWYDTMNNRKYVIRGFRKARTT